MRKHQATWTGPRRRHREAGIAMVLVLLAVAVASVLSLTFISAQSSSLGIARNVSNHAQARMIAESGMELAITAIRMNKNWREDMPNGVWAADKSIYGGTYTITVLDGLDEDGDGVVEGDGDLTDDDQEPVTLTVQGSYQGTTHFVRVELTSAIPVISQFAASDAIELKEDAVVDSYHSSYGAYGGTNVGDDAIVATNSRAKDKIKVKDRAAIHGSAYVGPGGSVAEGIQVEGFGLISGEQAVNDEPVPFPLITTPTMGGTPSDVTYSSGVTNISTDMHFKKLTVNGTAVLNITAPVTIVCDEEAIFDGSAAITIANQAWLRIFVKKKFDVKGTTRLNANTADPSRLHIYYQGGGHVHLEKDSDTHATIYAPWGELHMKDNAELFGTYTGRKAKLEKNSQFHHDLSTGFPSKVPPVIDTGIAVDDKIEVKDQALVDSFASSAGAYGGANVGSAATLSTNSSSSDKITIANSSIVRGDAYVAGDPVVGIKVDSGALLTGTRNALPAFINIPEVDAEPDVPLVYFGKQDVGADTVTNVAQIQIATKVTLPQNTLLSSITAYVGMKDQKVRYAIYTNSGGEPGSLIVQTNTAIAPKDTMAWLELTVPDTALSAGTYWLAIGFESNAHAYVYDSGISGAETRYVSNNPIPSTFSAAWGASSQSFAGRAISIYATGGGGSGNNDYTQSTGTVVFNSDRTYKKFSLNGTAILQIDGNVMLVCRDEFKMENNAQIQLLTGSTLEIYTRKRFKMDHDTLVNTTAADPTRLIIFAALNDDKFEMAKNARLYANLVVPYRDSELSDNAQVYGTFHGKKLKLEKQSMFHVDLDSVAEVDDSVDMIIRWVE